MEALGINLGLLIVQIIAFIIVFLTLNAWVYQPMLNMMETRKQKIAQGLEDARIAADARSSAEKDAAKIVAEAQVEASKIVREATERAATAGKDVKAAAEAEAVKARESAMAEAQLERNRILGDLRGQVASLAIAAANKLVGEALALDEKKQRALLDEFFSGVKSGKVVVVEGSFKGDAEVTSALPLTGVEQEAVKKNFDAKEITFKVDPAILGGLVVKIGDKVLDGSVLGKLEGLRQSLK